MTRNTTSKTQSAKLMHNVKLGYRTTYTNTKRHTPIWSTLVLFLAIYVIAATMNIPSFLPMSPDSGQVKFNLVKYNTDYDLDWYGAGTVTWSWNWFNTKNW